MIWMYRRGGVVKVEVPRLSIDYNGSTTCIIQRETILNKGTIDVAETIVKDAESSNEVVNIIGCSILWRPHGFAAAEQLTQRLEKVLWRDETVTISTACYILFRGSEKLGLFCFGQSDEAVLHHLADSPFK